MRKADGPSARLRAGRPVPYGWAVLGAVGVVVSTVGAVLWLLTVADQAAPDGRAQARIDAIRTGLSVGAGTGGAAALMLAFRRQHHQERATASGDHDAAERRVTELYGQAVEQLGSDKAAVRLGGLYALERLAQTTPDHRQVVVNVICAYLRMPRARRREELQVRLAAQRILSDHLCPDPADRHASAPSTPGFWSAVDLDLTGATLVNLDLSGCHLRQATFHRARFTGGTTFEGADFAGDATFEGARFTGDVSFRDAAFAGDARFRGAGFAGEVTFYRATFTEHAWFDNTDFADNAVFSGAAFDKDAKFGGAAFTGEVTFSKATFTGHAWFRETAFTCAACFDSTSFARNARFDGAAFAGKYRFDGARVWRGTGSHEWPPGWVVEPAAGGWQTLTRADSGLTRGAVPLRETRPP